MHRTPSGAASPPPPPPKAIALCRGWCGLGWGLRSRDFFTARGGCRWPAQNSGPTATTPSAEKQLRPPLLSFTTAHNGSGGAGRDGPVGVAAAPLTPFVQPHRHTCRRIRGDRARIPHPSPHHTLHNAPPRNSQQPRRSAATFGIVPPLARTGQHLTRRLGRKTRRLSRRNQAASKPSAEVAAKGRPKRKATQTNRSDLTTQARPSSVPSPSLKDRSKIERNGPDQLPDPGRPLAGLQAVAEHLRDRHQRPNSNNSAPRAQDQLRGERREQRTSTTQRDRARTSRDLTQPARRGPGRSHPPPRAKAERLRRYCWRRHRQTRGAKNPKREEIQSQPDGGDFRGMIWKRL